MLRHLSLVLLLLIAGSTACEHPDEILAPYQDAVPTLQIMDGPDSPFCDDCGTDLWCERWEFSCHLAEWSEPTGPCSNPTEEPCGEISINLSRTASEKHFGAWSAKHDFRISPAATIRRFGGINTEIVLEAACQFAPDFFLNAGQSGKHWLRLKGPNDFQLDTDFQRLPSGLGGDPYIRFVIYTPQVVGMDREWPLRVNCAEGFDQCDRILTLLQPYRDNWGFFRFEIKLNTPQQSNGYFRFFIWSENPPKWVLIKALENANITNNPANPAYFNEFHWSNYSLLNVPPNEGAYYYTDDLKIFTP